MKSENMQLTTENWSFSHYYNDPHRIFISFGGEPGRDPEEIVDLYYATIVDKDDREAFQKTFENLDSAMSYINENYNHWEFIESQ